MLVITYKTLYIIYEIIVKHLFAWLIFLLITVALYNLDDPKCGRHKPSRLIGLAKCLDLQDIVLGRITEKQLIESRIFKQLQNTDSICAFHRQKHGKSWASLKRCMHPLHSYTSIKKTKNLHPTTLRQYHIINTEYPNSFPTIENLCIYHRKTL